MYAKPVAGRAGDVAGSLRPVAFEGVGLFIPGAIRTDVSRGLVVEGPRAQGPGPSKVKSRLKATGKARPILTCHRGVLDRDGRQQPVLGFSLQTVNPGTLLFMTIPEVTPPHSGAAPVSPWPALLEVLALPVMGVVLALLIAAALGVGLSNPLINLRPDALPDSWLPLAADLLQVLTLQYTGCFLLMVAILWPRRELTPKRLGLTSNGFAWSHLLAMGLLLACLLVPLQMALLGADAHWDLGETSPWRRALLDAPRSADFWLLMAVASFGLVPLLEEVFYRGFLQGRLQQVMSPAHAIVLISTLFTLSHSQYHQPSVINIATALFVFCSSLVFGWLYWKTGSIWPSVLLHGTVNVPWPSGSGAVALGAVLLTVALMTHRRWRPWLGELHEMLRLQALRRALLAPMLLTVLFGVGFTLAGAVIVPVAALMLVAGLLWRWRLRRHGGEG